MILRSEGIIVISDPLSKASTITFEASFLGNVNRNMAARSVGAISEVMS